jgi:secreted PhoX family phosphatase
MLPSYACKVATDFTIQITPIYDGIEKRQYYAGEVQDGKFKVYGEPGKFYWIVHGKRLDIETEPLKRNVELKGYGPYKYLS